MKRRLRALIGLMLVPLMSTADTVDLSLATGDTHILGADANTYIGFSLAQGDVDGDGLADMIVGVPFASPNGRSTAGKVYVVYGDSNLTPSIDLSATGEFAVIQGDYVGGHLGRRVASGDINGDGYDDVLISAPFADPPSLLNAGVVYVLHGGPALADTTDLRVTAAAVTLNGGVNHQIGAALAAGDISGNGLEDLVIGAPNAEAFGTRSGWVNILYSPLDSVYNLGYTGGILQADLVVTGRDLNDNLGNDLAIADFDGDGRDDIAMAAFRAEADGETSAGEVYILQGRADFAHTFYHLSSQTPMATVQGDTPYDQAGYSIAAGDMTYDGIPDLAIGANTAEPSGSRTDCGIVYLVDGQDLSGVVDLADPADVLTTIWGSESGGHLGFSLDIFEANGDGMGDLLIGEPLAAGQGSQTGNAHLISGDQVFPPTIDLAALDGDRKILGGSAGNNTGYDVTGGDIDGDGLGDLMIAVPGGTGMAVGSGEVVLLQSPLPHVNMSPSDTTGRYGSTVELPIEIASTTGLKMVEVDLDLLYDSDVSTFMNVEATGTLVAGWDTLLVTNIVGGTDPDTLRLHGRTLGAATVGPGTFLSVTFDVTQVPMPDTSALVVDYLLFNGGKTEWNSLTPGRLIVVGADGELAATVVSTPGDTVRIRVTDPDGNQDSTVVETMVGITTNTRTGEIETHQLVESGGNDSVFFGSFSTLANAIGGNDNDGMMHVVDDDTLIVSVMDSLDTSGAATVRQVSNLVIAPLGDADDNGALQAYDASRILAHAIGLITLAGRDSMAANVDALAPAGSINSFDAVLVIQRALRLIDRFPVQADSAANHPQPETDDSVSKVLPEMIAVSWQRDGSELVLIADERRHILAGDLQILGLPPAAVVRPAADLSGALVVHQHDEGTLKVGLAIPYPIDGPGELLRIGPKPGTILPALSQVQLEGQFNGGTLSLRVQTAQLGVTTRPRELLLHKNFPNPFNAETTIRFDLPQAESVELSIYNSVGQHIRTLVNGVRPAGNHQIVWDSRTDDGQLVATGTYVYVLQSSGLRIARPLLLLK